VSDCIKLPTKKHLTQCGVFSAFQFHEPAERPLELIRVAGDGAVSSRRGICLCGVVPNATIRCLCTIARQNNNGQRSQYQEFLHACLFSSVMGGQFSLEMLFAVGASIRRV
jgi:hypothetical protein